VEIFENPTHGRVLCLDGIVQTTEADEFIYHEMLVHPAMFAHGGVREVLIIGGADGGALREVLRHPVDRATVVDIDAELIELCMTHLASISDGAHGSPRARVIPGDGAKYVENTLDRFDVVIVDSTDPVGRGSVLFQLAFFHGCRRVLKDGGIAVFQNGVPFYQPTEFRDSHACRRRVFAMAGHYLWPVPSYAGGHMAFGWGSDRLDPGSVAGDGLARRVASAVLPLEAYGADVHRAAFVLPNWTNKLLADARPAGP
jgi:spermidine synthase